MSRMKEYAYDVSVELGYDGEFNSHVAEVGQASHEAADRR